MRNDNYSMFTVTRIITSFLPLLLGLPILSFCICVTNAVMNTAVRGLTRGAISILVTSAAGGLFCALCGYGAVYGSFFALQLALAAALCTVSVITRRKFSTGLMLTSFGYGLGHILRLNCEAYDAGLSIADNMASGLKSNMGRMLASYQAAAGTDMNVTEFLDGTVNMLKNVFPTYVMLKALLAGYLTMWLVSRALRQTPLDNGHSFASIRLNLPALCLGLTAMFEIFLSTGIEQLVSINCFFVFFAYAVFAGISLTESLLRRKVHSLAARVIIHSVIIAGGFLLSMYRPLANVFFLYALMSVANCFVPTRKKATEES